MITKGVTVQWTVSKPLRAIPERFWGEDLSLLDKTHTGKVIDTHVDWFWGDTTLIVACNDNKVRKVNMDDVKILP
jgi:hypothetical protein